MFTSICKGPACLLAAITFIAVPTVALAQQAPAPHASTRAAFQQPADSAYRGLAARPYDSNAYLITASFNDGEKSLAKEVGDLKADLEAWKARALAKEAAAKKKAASKPSVKVGGRFMWDWANFNQDANSMAQIGDDPPIAPGGDVQNGSEPRRARLFIKGDAFHIIDYKLQFAFDYSSTLHYKDLFFTVKELPYLGHVRVGHYKEPFSLDQLTSSKYITFMERNLADVFAPARNVGIMAFDQSEDNRMTWAIGAFKDQIADDPPTFHDDHAASAVTMRYTFTPWYDEASGGRGLLHTGVGYSYRDATRDRVRFRQRPESHLCCRVVDTGWIPTEDYQLFNAELACVYGPFSLQSEYIMTSVNRLGGGTANFDGVYCQASYFLTGEHRRYRRSDGTFGRVKPFENFFRVRDADGCMQMGMGAWEVAYRYSYLDLNDAGIIGGRVSDHTLGLNWYLNPYTRVMWNYVRSDVNRPPAGGGAAIDGAMDIFEMRAQIDF